jgi:hypothetical protein
VVQADVAVRQNDCLMGPKYMTSTKKTRIIAVAGGILLVVAVGLVAARLVLRERHVAHVVKIVRIDVPTRTAAIELIHPRTGQPLEIEGVVPLGCEITIDGRPADLGELIVGEQAFVEASIRGNSITPQRVAVKRTDNQAAQPPVETVEDDGP